MQFDLKEAFINRKYHKKYEIIEEIIHWKLYKVYTLSRSELSIVKTVDGLLTDYDILPKISFRRVNNGSH